MQSKLAQKLLGEQADAPKDMTQDIFSQWSYIWVKLGKVYILLGGDIPLQESVPIPYSSAKSLRWLKNKKMAEVSIQDDTPFIITT